MGSMMPGASSGAPTMSGGMGLDLGGSAFTNLMQPMLGTPSGAANAGSFMQQLPQLLQKGGQMAQGGGQSGQPQGMQDIGMGLQALSMLLPMLL